MWEWWAGCRRVSACMVSRDRRVGECMVSCDAGAGGIAHALSVLLCDGAGACGGGGG